MGGLLLRLHLEVVEDVTDQVAQGFVIVHGPCGGDGPGMKNPAALGTFPINDLRNGLLAPYPRPMSLGIEIENVPFALASRYGDDPPRFDQTLQGGVLGRPEQGRKPHVVLVSDGALFRIGEPEWVSLFQIDLVGFVEQEVIRNIDLIIRKVPSAPSDAFQPDQLPGRVSAKSHQASTLEVMAMVELAYLGQFSAADTTTELATLHDLGGLVEAHPPEHRIAGHDHGCSARLEVVIQPVVSTG